MRARALSVILLVLWSSPAFAGWPVLGVKGGASYANVSFDNGADTKAEWFPIAGLFGTFAPHWGIELQPEVLYSVKGARLVTGGAKTIARLEYVEVPVLGRVSMQVFGRRVYLAGGPSFGLLVRARTRTAFEGVTEEVDVADELKTFDLGIAGGAGIEFGRFAADVRYTYGFSDIDKDTSDDVKAHNRTLSVTAAWRF